jgi:poly-beta-1,6-N-acetyl-D-glucosamine synthase
MGLQSGALLARHEILLCIDGDALLDPICAHWMVRHFMTDPNIGAVTGNPRIRSRSTLLGRIQVGEFSSIVGMIKRAQSEFGALMTVSGVITAFRRSAVHDVGYWSADMLTEDIDITWKLQRAGWKVAFDPGALVWILMPETLRGVWKQRLRWAQGGAQVLFKNAGVLTHISQRKMWPLFVEMCASALWAYSFLLLSSVWLLDLLAPGLGLPSVGSPILPQGPGLWLVATCLAQFILTMWMDNRYERGLWRYYYWIIWYPAAYWAINVATAAIAYPTIAFRRAGTRARWISPDRGIRS